MKKIILSSLVILGLVGAIVGATRAWFTDSEVLAGNTVTTGVLDVYVTPNPFTIDNIEPALAEDASYVSAGKFAVENIGDYDMKWRGKLVETADLNYMSNYLWVKVNMLAHGGQWVGGEWVNCDYGPDVGVTPLFSGVPLNDLEAYSGYLLMDDPTWAFEPGSYSMLRDLC